MASRYFEVFLRYIRAYKCPLNMYLRVLFPNVGSAIYIYILAFKFRSHLGAMPEETDDVRRTSTSCDTANKSD